MHFFSLAGDAKRNKGIDQFLNWSMKATYVAFRHDSNPSNLSKRISPIHWMGDILLAQKEGFEPSRRV